MKRGDAHYSFGNKTRVWINDDGLRIKRYVWDEKVDDHVPWSAIRGVEWDTWAGCVVKTAERKIDLQGYCARALYEDLKERIGQTCTQ